MSLASISRYLLVFYYKLFYASTLNKEYINTYIQLLDRYLEIIKPYLKDITDKYKGSGEYKTQLSANVVILHLDHQKIQKILKTLDE